MLHLHALKFDELSVKYSYLVSDQNKWEIPYNGIVQILLHAFLTTKRFFFSGRCAAHARKLVFICSQPCKILLIRLVDSIHFQCIYGYMRLSVCFYLPLSHTNPNFPAFSFLYFYKYRICDCTDFVLTVFVRLVTVTFSNMFGNWDVAEKSISYDSAMTINTSDMSIIRDLKQNSLKSLQVRETQKILLPSILNKFVQFEQPPFEIPILSEANVCETLSY